MLLQVQKGDLAHNEAGSPRLLRGTKDGAASDDVLHEFVNWSDATTLEDIFVRAPFVFLPLGSKLRDEVPPRHFETLSMLLDFRRLFRHIPSPMTSNTPPRIRASSMFGLVRIPHIQSIRLIRR